MADPTPYQRSYSFTNYQADTPDRPLPGNRVDVELDNIAENSRILTETVNAGFKVDANLEDIVKVGDEIEKVVFVADNMPDVRAAAGVAPYVQQAIALFLGAFPEDPTEGTNGDPLTIGATYYNTVISQSFVWTGSAWVPVAQVSVGGVLQGSLIVADGETTFTIGDYVSVTVARNGRVLRPGIDYTTASPDITVPLASNDDEITWFGILKGSITDAAAFVRQTILTTTATRYSTNTDGQPLNLTPSNHILFGASPFAVLTYGVDYTVDAGDPVFSFTPEPGELYHVFSMPRFTNTEAQVLLAEIEGRVSADADRAEAAANRADAATPFANYNNALAAASSVPAPVQRISWIAGSREVSAVRYVGGPLLGGGWAPNGQALPAHFNITNEAVDQTDRYRAFHAWCNSTGEDAVYHDVTRITVLAQDDVAQAIPIHTNVDFRGAPIYTLNSYHASPRAMPRRVFIIADPATPLTTVSGTVTDANLAAFSTTPTADVYSGDGFVLLQTAKQVPNRENDGTINYQQVFWLTAGNAVQPLSEDLQGFNAVTVLYRRPSARRLAVKNVNLIDDGFNNLTLLRVERNQVDIAGMVVQDTPSRRTTSIDNVIMIVNCGDISYRDASATARPATGGSYVFGVYGCAELHLDRLSEQDAPTGNSWGVMGANDLNGVYITDCDLNRIDAHFGGHNIYVRGGTLRKSGTLIGSGGGVFSFSGVKAIKCPMWAIRSDYGSYFSNAVIRIDDKCEWQPVTTAGAYGNALIDMGSGTVGLGGLATTRMPRIEIGSVDVISTDAAASNRSVQLVLARVRATAQPVIAPALVSIENVTLSSNLFPGVTIDWASLDRIPAGTITTSRLWLSNVRAAIGIASTGVFDLPASRAPGTAVSLEVYVKDCTQANVVLQYLVPAYMEATGSSLWNFTAQSAFRCLVSGCVGVAGASAAKLGGNFSNAFTSTKVLGFIANTGTGPYDLSNAAALSGVMLATNGVLPAGVTAAQAFSGWLRP